MDRASSREFPNPLPTRFAKHVRLVTGATGFLGKRLLMALQPSLKAPIICLVRARNEAVARQLGANITSDPNVLWLPGDIQKPHLALNSATWHALASATQEVYHCAESGNSNLSLAKTHAINVDGTERLLALAEAAQKQGGFRRLHFVSSAYAAGLTTGLVGAEYLPADHASNFRNTYERTKARAERVLRKQTRIPISIYRPSIIAGDTVSGSTDCWHGLYTPIRQLHCGRLPYLPKSGAGLIDCVGVDYVAHGIAHLARIPQPNCASFHLTTGTGCFNVSELLDACLENCKRYDPGFRGDCTIVSPLQWHSLKLAATTNAKLSSHGHGRNEKSQQSAKFAQRNLDDFAPYEPYTGVNTCFDNRTAHRELAQANIVMPHWPLYLTRIIRFALQANFGNRAVDQTPAEQNVVMNGAQTTQPSLDLVAG